MGVGMGRGLEVDEAFPSIDEDRNHPELGLISIKLYETQPVEVCGRRRTSMNVYLRRRPLPHAPTRAKRLLHQGRGCTSLNSGDGRSGGDFMAGCPGESPSGGVENKRFDENIGCGVCTGYFALANMTWPYPSGRGGNRESVLVNLSGL